MARVERVRVGTGITARTKVIERLDPGELVKFVLRQNARLLTLWGSNERILDAASDRLAEIKAATPTAMEDNDAWDAVFGRERETEGWYLRSIAIERQIAETAMEEDRPNEAVQAALLIGEYLTELRFKMLWEPQALAGEKALEGGRIGGERRARSFAGRHDAIRADYSERLARLGDERRAKEATAKNFNVSRRQLNRILAK